LVVVLLLGSLGVQSRLALLAPEQEAAPKALAVIPTAAALIPNQASQPANAGTRPNAGGNFSRLAAPVNGPAPVGQGFGGGQFGAGNAPANAGPITRQSIAQGNGSPVPQGGFAPASAAANSAPAVPEPSTWALICLGAAMIGWVAYRDRQRSLAAKA
jgi:hypothetical protein